MAAALGQQYDSTGYPPFGVAVDLAVFTIRSGALQVLLIERPARTCGTAVFASNAAPRYTAAVDTEAR